MVPPRKEDPGHGDDGSDRADRPFVGDALDGSVETNRARIGARSGSITDRLRDAIQEDSDVDLLLSRSCVETGFLPWLRALDMQALGGCRADERLKPLLALNVSGGVAEDRFMAQLSLHFEASEIGILARCLCVPLVSIRVGKVNKQGNLLCPTSTRGFLNLTLFPLSAMCISFFGDDGCVERLAVVCNNPENSDIAIEEITADVSGRSFLLNLPGSRTVYFWCSEKSKFQGMHLLTKMRDLLRRKPSLSHLSGISESRLNSFSADLQAYFHGLTDCGKAINSNDPSSDARISASTATEPENDSQSSSLVSKSSSCHLGVAHTAKLHASYQGSLGPKSNTFKDGLPRSSSFTRSGKKEKLRRHGDGHSNMSVGNCQLVSPSSGSFAARPLSSIHQVEDEKLFNRELCNSAQCCLAEMPCLSPLLSSHSPFHLPLSEDAIHESQTYPYYCWCPPYTPSLQFVVANPCPPATAMESMLLPPLSSVLLSSGTPASIIPSKAAIGVTQLHTLDIPNLLHESLVSSPLPASSLISMSNPQQIPTFTPLMSDPIVHVPIIDVCSSGQGYLVNTGPAIPTSIPPLLPKIIDPNIPKSEAAVEKSARETLRMLLASTPMLTGTPIVNVLPAGNKENVLSLCNVKMHDGLLAVSQGLHDDVSIVDAVVIATTSTDLSCLDERVTEDTCKLDVEAEDL